MTKLSKSIPCIINKNTIELRMFLEKIGCTYAGNDSKRYGNFIYCAYGNYYITNNKPSRGEPIIDCNNNEAMFKLVVTLKIDKPDEPLDSLKKTEIISIQKGISEIKIDKTFKMNENESLTEFLNRIKNI